MQSHGAIARSNSGPSAGLSRGLGLFSVGLGIAELAAPRVLARAIGVDPHGRTSTTIRALGVRELVNGLGILLRPRASLPLWARVGGDAIDLAFLAWAFGAKRTSMQRLVGAFVAVASVAALDVIASRRTAKAARDAERPVARSITIYKPAADVYAFWRDFEQLPRAMSYLESVVDLDGDRSRWTAKGGLSWEAEVIEDLPGQRLEWRTVRGSTLPNRGCVTFKPVLGGSATEVTLEMQIGHGAAAALAGLIAGPQIMGDLRRVKQVLETGEIARSDASIHFGPHPAHPSKKGGQP